MDVAEGDLGILVRIAYQIVPISNVGGAPASRLTLVGSDLVG